MKSEWDQHLLFNYFVGGRDLPNSVHWHCHSNKNISILNIRGLQYLSLKIKEIYIHICIYIPDRLLWGVDFIFISPLHFISNYFSFYVYHIYISFLQQTLLNINYVTFTVVYYTMLSHIGQFFNLYSRLLQYYWLWYNYF